MVNDIFEKIERCPACKEALNHCSHYNELKNIEETYDKLADIKPKGWRPDKL